MLIKDVLLRDPATHPLINQGQARIVETSNARALEELRGELSTFVCEGQFAHGIHTVINSFLYNLGRTNQKAAWISGFYGSGKSHLLKMLSHIWADTVFPDGATARSLVPAMPDDLRSLLRELDTAGKRSGGLLSAAGSLPRGSTDHVRLTILGIIFRAVGLPSGYPQARFCIWLKSRGFLDAVTQAVEDSGKSFETELNNLYVSGPLARAVLECDVNFASGEATARETMRQQFPPQTNDITTDEFLSASKETLKLYGRDNRVPCTLLVLDEVQQYIGESHDRSMLVTEVVEAISKELDSHVMVVGAGQMALTEVSLLQKLMDRFTINIPLSDAEVETVTRKVLLAKQPSALPDVRKCMTANAGEISRQLQGTRIAEASEDQKILAEDYPLLPVRRRFWEHCFRQIDAAGTHSQLRSQLRIVHDAVAKLSTRQLGGVIPADELFEALAPEMVNTGVLLREINERILALGKDGSKEGRLARRTCGLVFLIGKLKRDGVADIGVRATREHIADLLVDDLTADNGKLRSDVEAVLNDLSSNGTLMLVGDEYRLQTREGSEWDREYRNFQTRLNNDEAAIQFKRDQLLYAEADKIIRSVSITQGTAKVPRQFAVSRDQVLPQTDGLTIPVWIRDGWSGTEKEILDTARSAGSDSPVIFVFIPRQAAEDLRRLIVEADAANQTIAMKGSTTTEEGREARQSMESRYTKAVSERDRTIQEIIANTKVFQGGGSGVIRTGLDERIRDAANDSIVRLFPRFNEADSGAWEAVIKRARDGADQPFQPVGHTDATEKHRVCQQVIATIGSGKAGTEIRKILRGIGFGWPQDAIDAALIALHRIQHISAILNGAAVLPGHLDQNKIAKAEFRVEQATLSVQDKLLIRKLFTQAAVPCKSNDELSAKTPEFLKSMTALARAAGGQPPLPPVPSTTAIEEIERKIGNEQLSEIIFSPQIEADITEWTQLKERADKRKPAWGLLESIAVHAKEISAAEPILTQINAIREHRSLLETNDPSSSMRVQLVDILRGELNRLYTAHESMYKSAMSALQSDGLWQQIGKAEQETTVKTFSLLPPTIPNLASDEAVLAELNSKTLQTRQTEIDAIPGRVKQTIERAAKILEPKVQTVNLERATLRSRQDVDNWVERQRKTLVEAVEKVQYFSAKDTHMPTLHKDLRTQLERTILEARHIAEDGAQKAVELLAVHHHEPWGHMTSEAKSLRNRLRAHGRQLGDRRDAKRGTQEITHLITECAYEHWHRMLFARFLAESDLLIEPDSGVPITLSDCQALATERGKDWLLLASQFAQHMLPQIFRVGNPILDLSLPAETRAKLESRLSSLPDAVFQADDSLGWVYQYWQSKRKEEINESEIKIGANELPAVTQLFTEPYMVHFLLDNSLGAWWASRRLSDDDLTNAQTEDELRQKISLPELPLEFLRFTQITADKWTPAGGTFAQWPQQLRLLKILDPCCGSGHFLVATFLMLVPMRVELEHLTVKEAVDAVLRENIHGLEIDPRCVELAAFALALAAWRYPGAPGYRPLPELNVACTGLSLSVAKEEWKQLALDKHNLRIALDWIYDVFRDAPLLGSLIDPAKTDAVKLVEWDDLAAIIEKAQAKVPTDEQQEAGVVASGLAKASTLLAKQYDLIATNVPYLSAGKQHPSLREFCKNRLGKNDLATTFLERCQEFCAPGGVTGLVIPQNLLYLKAYEGLRKQILDIDEILIVANGPAAFQEMNWWAANTMIFLIQKSKPQDNHSYSGLDSSDTRVTAEKPTLLKSRNISIINQKSQLSNADARITFEHGSSADLLESIAGSYQGVSPADFPRFGRCFWELPNYNGWCFWQSTVKLHTMFGGRELVLWLDEVRRKSLEEGTAYIRGTETWGKRGIVVSAMRELPCTISEGKPTDTNVAIILPHDPDNLAAIWCFCSSSEYNKAVRKIDQSVKVTNSTLGKVPFDLDYWKQIASERYPEGLPLPESTDPTQWIFHGHPAHTTHPLQVAVMRLLGYRVPAELDESIELTSEAGEWIHRTKELLPLTDDDGIACLSSLKGEPSAADRLMGMLAQAYGSNWSAAKLDALLSDAGHRGTSLEQWLRDFFFAQHCDTFHQHPLIWHIWDGRPDGFHALCNYHMLAAPEGTGQRTLEKLIYTYLGDWIERQRSDQKKGIEGADARIAAAEHLRQELEKIRDGEPPFDLFVRWRPLHEQPIGWNPDLNDGARINIRPFMMAKPLSPRSASACILRTTPKVTWGKDRGKESARNQQDYPWFWSWNGRTDDFSGNATFDGNRWNDLHYSNQVKNASRKQQLGSIEVPV